MLDDLGNAEDLATSPRPVLMSSSTSGSGGLTPYYHGTTVERAEGVVRGIDLESGRPNLDFNPTGQGSFYVTKDRAQAERWAREAAADVGGEPALVRYDVPEAELRSLSVKSFDNTGAEWQDFVRMSRSGGGGPDHHYFDLVEGPYAVNPSVAERPMSATPIRGRGDQTALCTGAACALFDRSNPRIVPVK
jgi:hypothetical protein